MMNKKLIFSCIIFVFCINSYGQFNTIMSKKVEGTPVVVQPLYGPCLYESVNDIVIDSATIAVPEEDIEPISISFSSDKERFKGVKLFAFRFI